MRLQVQLPTIPASTLAPAACAVAASTRANASTACAVAASTRAVAASARPIAAAPAAVSSSSVSSRTAAGAATARAVAAAPAAVATSSIWLRQPRQFLWQCRHNLAALRERPELHGRVQGRRRLVRESPGGRK